jgi:FKBP-type peptidyl-prolyl cis-trans isomerase
MKTLVAALALTLATTAIAADAPATPPAAPVPATAAASNLQTEKQRIGYAIGLQIGGNLKGIDIDTDAVAAGVRDAATGAKPQLTEAEVLAAMEALEKQFLASRKKVGDAFLAENAKKEGVKTTASGLQYKVIKSGTGKTPKAEDTVSVNYKGTLISGKVFDASEEPVTFPVKGVIAGWTEALQLMKEGDKWMVYIPSNLAYGERPRPGGPIGPNEALIFEVELVSVK